MKLDETIISRAIIDRFTEKLKDCLRIDVAIVGGGPAGLMAAMHLAGKKKKVALFERKLSIGGGMWGGGMMFNEAVIQEDAAGVAEEMGIRLQPRGLGYYTFDSVEAASCLSYRCIQAGTRIMNCVRVEDVMFREESGVKRVCGLVINWSPVKSLDLHVDPLSVRSSYVVDGTGHPAEITTLITRKMGVRLNNATGQVVGELPLWAHEGEQFTVVNTNEVYPGLFVTGMAANNAYGGPRMGPIFGGMLLSGKKAAEMIIERLPRRG